MSRYDQDEALTDDDGYPTEDTLEAVRTAEAAEALAIMKRAWYPTEDTLEAVRTAEAAEALAIMKRAWWGGAVVNVTDKHERRVVGLRKGAPALRFATVGWSGNEALVAAYHENRVAWASTWLLSTAGGLHIFEMHD